MIMKTKKIIINASVNQVPIYKQVLFKFSTITYLFKNGLNISLHFSPYLRCGFNRFIIQYKKKNMNFNKENFLKNIMGYINSKTWRTR